MSPAKLLAALALAAVALTGAAPSVSSSAPVAAASAGFRCGESDDPTPTAPAATATPTATATAPVLPSWTPAASVTPVPTWTASPVPTVCTRERVEVVLVIDASTSMLRPTSAGRSKLSAALDAAGVLVGMLDFAAGDAAAVVAFNDETWTALMSSDEATVRAALDRIPGVVQEGTRLDLAIAAGGLAHLLAPARIGDAREVIVLLTDGLPNRVPFGPGSPYPSCPDQECSTLKEADRVKALGLEVVAVGLGLPGEVLDRLMIRIPTDPAEYYRAPDGEDLADIYRRIAAGLVECSGALDFHGVSGGPAPMAPAWSVKTVDPAAARPGERILVGGDRAPTGAELQTVALYNRGHIVRDPVLAAAGFGLVWTPGRDNERLDWRGDFDLQGSGVQAWREEVGALLGSGLPAEIPAGPNIGRAALAGDPGPAMPLAAAASFWPSDPHFPDQWALRGLFGLGWSDAIEDFAALGDAGAGAVLAVIDQPLECSHPDLRCFVGTHYNGTTGQALEHRSAADTQVGVSGIGYDHGTFVAGLAAAYTGNGYGVAGISRASALSVQGCIGGGCAEADVIRALGWIGQQVDAGVPVQAVNMSFAFKTERLCKPADALRARGVVPFAAVGNSGDRTTGGNPQYPAACDSVVGVAYSQENGAMDPQSQRAAVDLTAPGSDVRSLCARPHTTGVGSGSSFASPSAAAAYLVARAALAPAVGNAQAAEMALDELRRSAVPVEPASHARGVPDPDRDGFGRIDLAGAAVAVRGLWASQGVPTPTEEPIGLPPMPGATATCPADPVRCAAAGTATALAVGTPTPTATPTLDPTVAAILTAEHTPATPTPTPTINPTAVARLLTEWAPTATPDKRATAEYIRCFTFGACAGRAYLPRLAR